MFCPRCATENIEDARFCRACGANLSLVPQALTGRLPERPSEVFERAIKRHREPRLARGITRTFLGLGFLIVAAGLLFSGRSSGFGAIWLLIPAFFLLGKGIAEIVSVISAEPQTDLISRQPAQPAGERPDRALFDAPPPSVTERTTRHMEPVSKSPSDSA